MRCQAISARWCDLIRNMSTPEAREFWRFVDQCADEVALMKKKKRNPGVVLIEDNYDPHAHPNLVRKATELARQLTGDTRDGVPSGKCLNCDGEVKRHDQHRNSLYEDGACEWLCTAHDWRAEVLKLRDGMIKAAGVIAELNERNVALHRRCQAAESLLSDRAPGNKETK